MSEANVVKRTREEVMRDQSEYTMASTDITILWRKLFGYVPASEQPEIAAKQAYYRNREWMKENQQ
jgi:hypothetical protein